MTAASSSRFMPVFWFVLFVFLFPFGVAYTIFEFNQFEIGVVLALMGLLIWLIAQGAGWRSVEKDTVVLVRDSLDNLSAHPKGNYFFFPVVHSVVARMPVYPLTFEFTVEGIDTQTSRLSRISKIRVRTACTISDPRAFFRKSASFLDRIYQIEETTKLRRTDAALWRKLLGEAMETLVDNGVRDVVWRWKEHLERDPALKVRPAFELKKLGDFDPFDLSVNRHNLARQVTAEIATIARSWGVSVDALVFESIEIDPEIIKGKNREFDKELSKAAEEAQLAAAAILERGKVEAEVRSVTLAKLLDVLINKYDIPHTDPLIAQVVRAALYSDGQMVWHATIEKPAGDAKAK